MNRLKPGVDIVLDILVTVAEALPQSVFANSILKQYQERGGLSKKQLEGLYQKAQKLGTIPPAKLATLEAIILKKPTRYKSELPATQPLFTRDPVTGDLIKKILSIFPAHKRVLFLQAKYENNEVLTSSELADLQQIARVAEKKGSQGLGIGD